MPIGRDKFVEVLFRDRSQLVAYVLVIVGDPHLAEDVAQEAFKLAFERCEAFDDSQHLRAWLRGTARNMALAEMRKRHRGPLLLDSAVLDLIDRNWARLDAVEPQTLQRALRHCLHTLSPSARQVVEMRYGQNLTGERLAAQLGRNLAGVYKALTRIHQSLGDCIRRRVREELGHG